MEKGLWKKDESLAHHGHHLDFLGRTEQGLCLAYPD